MEKPLTITAISGWALPPEWFHSQIKSVFPDTKINVLYPCDPCDPREAERLIHSTETDLYLGYSLGSLWLMTYHQMLPKDSVKAVLAPVLAFTRERGRGGKTPETKLKYLIRQLKKNPSDPSPLLEFYSEAGIQMSDAWLKKIPEIVVLLKGLEFLQSATVPEVDDLDVIALVGENDVFLDAGELKRFLPELEIIHDAGHAPGSLLKRLATILDFASNG
jgi:hypothetical protein